MHKALAWVVSGDPRGQMQFPAGAPRGVSEVLGSPLPSSLQGGSWEREEERLASGVHLLVSTQPHPSWRLPSPYWVSNSAHPYQPGGLGYCREISLPHSHRTKKG
jgi:hypothetical protein